MQPAEADPAEIGDGDLALVLVAPQVLPGGGGSGELGVVDEADHAQRHRGAPIGQAGARGELGAGEDVLVVGDDVEIVALKRTGIGGEDVLDLLQVGHAVGRVGRLGNEPRHQLRIGELEIARGHTVGASEVRLLDERCTEAFAPAAAARGDGEFDLGKCRLAGHLRNGNAGGSGRRQAHHVTPREGLGVNREFQFHMLASSTRQEPASRCLLDPDASPAHPDKGATTAFRHPSDMKSNRLYDLLHSLRLCRL